MRSCIAVERASATEISSTDLVFGRTPLFLFGPRVWSDGSSWTLAAMEVAAADLTPDSFVGSLTPFVCIIIFEPRLFPGLWREPGGFVLSLLRFLLFLNCILHRAACWLSIALSRMGELSQIIQA